MNVIHQRLQVIFNNLCIRTETETGFFAAYQFVQPNIPNIPATRRPSFKYPGIFEVFNVVAIPISTFSSWWCHEKFVSIGIAVKYP